MSELSFNTAAKYFLYRGNTGELIHRPRDKSLFKNNQSYSSWHSRCLNKPVLKKNNSGYLVATIFKSFFNAHRVCWLLYYGEMPKGQIDHINGIKDDNRISNLRDVTTQENLKNKRLYKNNKSGFMGVSWDRKAKKWRSQISIDKKLIVLGLFIDKAEAVKARKKAIDKSDFHENHGTSKLTMNDK